jgi:hypothetical protein
MSLLTIEIQTKTLPKYILDRISKSDPNEWANQWLTLQLAKPKIKLGTFFSFLRISLKAKQGEKRTE